MGLKEMLAKAIADEETRKSLIAAFDEEVKAAEHKGHNMAGYERRKFESDLAAAQKEAEAERAKAQRAMEDAAKLNADLAGSKDAIAQIETLTKERDALAPFRADFENRRLQELVTAKVRLADPALFDYVARQTGAKLEPGETPDQFKLTADAEKALDAWAADPANQHRIARQVPNAPGGIPRPHAPPVAGGSPFTDPVLAQRFAGLPADAQVRVQQELQRQQTR